MKEIKKLNKEINQLKRRKPADLDAIVHHFHDEVFAHTDCLKCAACCKTISPMITDRDIERISSQLRMKPSVFKEKYLYLDIDRHFVFKVTPCPFLGGDNYCSIYRSRPKACREYPHTNRKKFFQLLDITVKNSEICPAVSEIVKKLKSYYFIFLGFIIFSGSNALSSCSFDISFFSMTSS